MFPAEGNRLRRKGIKAMNTELFRCVWHGCERAFESPNALRMHVARTHTKTLQPNRESLPKDEQLRRKRSYNAAMRARYVAQGLTSAGKPRKRAVPHSPTAILNRRLSYKQQRDRYYAQGLNAKGKPFKMDPAGVRGIQQAQRARRAREHEARGNSAAQRKPKRIQFVYPLPQTDAPPTTTTEPKQAVMLHCPHCGENLTKWKYEN